jgi:hypothetical protein
VWWTNNHGVEVNAPSSTEWDHKWYWEDTVSLVEGPNQITVYAQDVAGNVGSDTVTVIYQNPTPPPPPPPPQTAKTLDIRQGKFTFYFGSGSGSAASDPVYNGIDRVSTVAYLQKSASETFAWPYNTDVTVTIEAPDPRPGHSGEKLHLFTQTIPAGTVTSTGKYRYVHSGGGIYEFTLESYTSTTVYLYVFVDRVNFLLDIKSSMTPDQYWQFARSISSYSVTIQIGDTAWVGSAKLVPGTYTYHKQELVYNR